MTTRADVETWINDALSRMGLDRKMVLLRSSDGMATPYVEGDAAPFDYIVSERGKELRRECGLNGDDLAYLILRDVALMHALRLEASTRGENVYSRKTWMDAVAKQMGRARADWELRISDEFAEVLKEAPLSPVERANTRTLPLPPVDGGVVVRHELNIRSDKGEP
ncbi:MAG: hypothetical protein KJO42_03885 [Silicimonas sp.]|nr:hypothetical protein [Silicimonas sp.]NNE79361.1 hypothetical protein [Silicimonas sp.]